MCQASHSNMQHSSAWFLSARVMIEEPHVKFISAISTSKRSSGGLIQSLTESSLHIPWAQPQLALLDVIAFPPKSQRPGYDFCVGIHLFFREREWKTLSESTYDSPSVLALWDIMHSGDRFLHSFLIRTILSSCVQSGVSCCHCRNENRLESKLSMDMGPLQPHYECQTLRCLE